MTRRYNHQQRGSVTAVVCCPACPPITAPSSPLWHPEARPCVCSIPPKHPGVRGDELRDTSVRGHEDFRVMGWQNERARNERGETNGERIFGYLTTSEWDSKINCFSSVLIRLSTKMHAGLLHLSVSLLSVFLVSSMFYKVGQKTLPHLILLMTTGSGMCSKGATKSVILKEYRANAAYWVYY